jgi:hypothetical protein
MRTSIFDFKIFRLYTVDRTVPYPTVVYRRTSARARACGLRGGRGVPGRAPCVAYAWPMPVRSGLRTTEARSSLFSSGSAHSAVRCVSCVLHTYRYRRSPRDSSPDRSPDGARPREPATRQDRTAIRQLYRAPATLAHPSKLPSPSRVCVVCLALHLGRGPLARCSYQLYDMPSLQNTHRAATLSAHCGALGHPASRAQLEHVLQLGALGRVALDP